MVEIPGSIKRLTPVMIYMIEIKFCPFCGEDLSQDLRENN